MWQVKSFSYGSKYQNKHFFIVTKGPMSISEAAGNFFFVVVVVPFCFFMHADLQRWCINPKMSGE